MRIVRLEGQRLSTEQALARKRRHLRNLRDIQAKGKASGDIEAEIAETEAEIAALQARLEQLPQPPQKPGNTRFYVLSYTYTDLSLGDHMGIFDEWQCEHYDEEGNLESIVVNTGARCSECGRARKQVVTACPRCGAQGQDWRGEGDGGARMCRKCGYRAWTLGASQYHDAEGKRLTTYHSFPLAPRIKKLFSAVLVDEAQEAKSKLSLRGAAIRGLRGNGRAILTGTWMKGYITDLYWTAGWLLGFGSPAWPFPYRGGSARFLEQFGTFQYVTKEFADTLQVGRRRLIPSVSNLNRLWRLLGPVSIHRPKEYFNADLPPKHVQVHWIAPEGLHAKLVAEVEGEAADILRHELRKPQEKINRGVISMVLWWTRYVASCPTRHGCLHYAGAYGHRVPDKKKATRAELKAIQDMMCLEKKVLSGEAAYSFNKVRKVSSQNVGANPCGRPGGQVQDLPLPQIIESPLCSF
ncbi:MAG: DEAD/DEAH box helicase [Anaerolineae bacterium]|nr:DEAD/DEAH box helicase [Anaerolineae bacterium]